MGSEAIKPAKAALIQYNEQFQVHEQLSMEPVALERTADNANAYVHALRLATYEFPEAFGSGYKVFPLSSMRLAFASGHVTTYGIGEEHHLQAGVSVYIPRGQLGGWGSDFGVSPPPPSIEFLFKHQALKDLSVGRNLARAALSHLIVRGCSEVAVSVTSGNPVIRRAYERFGFREVNRTNGSGCKIIKMMLSGQDEIIAARNKLENQL